jgi:small-conductance mechanosensitive channel
LIKINLTPLDELDNPFWYVPDFVAMSLAGVACWFYMSSSVEEKLMQVEELQSETAQIQSSYDNIAQDLEKFKNLENEVNNLQGKIAALKQITVSKLSKYESVVLLEHLQTLKPDGLWYEKIEVKSANRKVEAIGRSFDPILVAEFMGSLYETKTQKVEPTDLRTQLFFSDVKIVTINQPPASNVNANDINFNKYPTYKLEISYQTREAKSPSTEIN